MPQKNLRMLMSISTIVFLTFIHQLSYADSELSQHDKLKAAYLFNFTRFIAWQTSADKTPPEVINICLNGSNEPFERFLQAVASQRNISASSPAVNVVKYQNTSARITCHLSYIRNAYDMNISQDKTLLSIGDNPNISHLGTSINFFQQNDKIRFEVYPLRLSEQGVSLSSELMKLARVVQE